MLEIFRISNAECERLLNDCRPLGLFYVINNNMFVGIDNSRGECFVKEFTNKEECINWLKDTCQCAI